MSSAGGSSATGPQISEHLIFAPGALVEAVTVSNESITGEVLAFEYDHKLLILSKFSHFYFPFRHLKYLH